MEGDIYFSVRSHIYHYNDDVNDRQGYHYNDDGNDETRGNNNDGKCWTFMMSD